MRVTYEIPGDVVSAVEGRAGESQKTVDEYVTDHLRETVTYPAVKNRVADLVCEGYTDAEIAAVMKYVPGRIATIRRELGLKPNRRYHRGA